MMRTTTVLAVASLGAAFLFGTPVAIAQLDDHVWVGGTGNQLWQVDTNWDLGMFPNDPGRVDPDPLVISNVEGANLSVNLAANLTVNVGATDVTVAALTLGSTSGAVATNVTSTGAGRLVFENFESNNTTVEPNICAFNCGAPLITSQGVAGATNTISAVIGLNDTVQVTGTKNITLSGGLAEMGSSAALSALSPNATVFLTGNFSTVDTGVTGGADDTPLVLNNSGSSQGTIDVTAVISGAGRMRYGTQVSNASIPFGNVILRSANNYTGRTIVSRGNLVLANDSALGTGDVKEEGPSEGSLQTGYNVLSDNDSRTIANDRIVAQWMTIKGSNSLTWTGIAYQDNGRGWINMLPAGKTLTLSGGQFPNHTEEVPPLPGRTMVFDGSGRTVITGGLHNEWSTDTETIDPGNFVGSFRFRGTGAKIISGNNSTYSGSTYIGGGNVHFASSGNPGLNIPADYGNTTQFVSEAGAVGVDTGVVANSAFLGLFNNSSNPAADDAGNLVVFDRGGLMLGTGEYGSNLDFTAGSLANTASMSLAAHEGGSTYTGTITPANSTYRLGGGSGTLTLPNANQLTGARSLVATNGGEVAITANNNYTGTTSLIAKYVTSLQVAAANDTINFSDGDNIPNDQQYLGTTLTATTLANGGAASSIGSSTNVAGNLYIQGSTLKYVGAATSTDRLFTIGSGGATIDSSGSGAVNFTNASALGVDIAEARTGNINAFATGNGAADRSTIRNLTSTEDLRVGMPIMSPGLPTSGESAGIKTGVIITRISGPNDVTVGFATPPVPAEDPVGNFAFYNNTSITFGAAPERKLTLTGANTGNNTLASLIPNASDGGLVGVTKTGAGKWILSGNNTYGGTTTVSAGTLLVNGTQSGTGLTTVAAGATLGGTGALGGGLTNNGTIAPGASVGTLGVNGNVIMGENSHFAVELSGATADKLAVTGNFDLSALGNFLDVTGAGSGSSWIIATYTGMLTGTFENITSGYSVNYGTGTNSQVTLNLSGPVGVPGDYNNNGVVDAADYVLWRNGGPLQNEVDTPGVVNNADYTAWRARFGNTSGAGASVGASSAVPEPTGVVLIGLALVSMFSSLRRR